MTEIEFDRAAELSMPILKFVSYQKKEERQERFINEKILVPGSNCGRFRSLADFADVLHNSLRVYFENVEGFSYNSIWGDIKIMQQCIEDDINAGSLRMHIYEDGGETAAIDQICTSIEQIEELMPTIYSMYYACTEYPIGCQQPKDFRDLLKQKWESYFLGLPNCLSVIRLATSFLKIFVLQHRLLTECWTESLRQEVIAARDQYIGVSGNSYYMD